MNNLKNYIPIQVPINTYQINYNGYILDTIQVKIDKEEYEICEKSSHNMWANNKKGKWGLGYKNTVEDPRKVERAGRLGEMAFGKVSGSSVDLSYIKYGDKQDAIFRGKRVNIKTAFDLYGVVMIQCEINGYIKPLYEDVYVFAYLSADNRNEKRAVINFLGCLLKPEVITKRKVSKHNWVNYECPYSELHTMNELFSIPTI